MEREASGELRMKGFHRDADGPFATQRTHGPERGNRPVPYLVATTGWAQLTVATLGAAGASADATVMRAAPAMIDVGA